MRRTLFVALGVLFAAAGTAVASHIPGRPCSDCASHEHWPTIHGKVEKANNRRRSSTAPADRTSCSATTPPTSCSAAAARTSCGATGRAAPTSRPQRDRIYGGGGDDFIYGSHGRNVIFGGAGNDAISVHYGRGFVDCGPGRDIIHVARSRKRGYKFRNCEKVDYRSEAQRGGGLKPLP